MTKKVYVASSWRNPHYETVLAYITGAGHKVWDWRKPPTGGSGFTWQDAGVDGYQHGDKLTPSDWKYALGHPVACAGFASDMCGMNWCDVGVLLHPCGRSAHLEAGWLAGRGKPVHLLVLEECEPDLMVLALNGQFYTSIENLIWKLAQ